MNKVFTVFCLQVLEFTLRCSEAKELVPQWVFILVNECFITNHMILNTITIKNLVLITHPLSLLMACEHVIQWLYIYDSCLQSGWRITKISVKIALFWVRRKQKWPCLCCDFRKCCCGCSTLGTCDKKYVSKVPGHRDQFW